MPSVIMNVGILIGFIGGEFLTYYAFPTIGIFFSTVFLCLFGFFPESPHYLFVQNRRQSAIKSFRFYRGSNEDPSQEESFLNEFKNYKEYIEDTIWNLSDFCKLNFNSLIINIKKLIYLCFTNIPLYIDSQYTIKPLIYSFILYQLSALCGMGVMINYTSKIFIEAGTSLSPNICAIIIGLITLSSSLCIFVFIEKFGRKVCIICL